MNLNPNNWKHSGTRDLFLMEVHDELGTLPELSGREIAHFHVGLNNPIFDLRAMPENVPQEMNLIMDTFGRTDVLLFDPDFRFHRERPEDSTYVTVTRTGPSRWTIRIDGDDQAGWVYYDDVSESWVDAGIVKIPPYVATATVVP